MFEPNPSWDICLELRGYPEELALVKTLKKHGYSGIVGTVHNNPLLTGRAREVIRQIHETGDIDVVVFTPRYELTLGIQQKLGSDYEALAASASFNFCLFFARKWNVARFIPTPDPSDSAQLKEDLTLPESKKDKIDLRKLLSQEYSWTDYEFASHFLDIETSNDLSQSDTLRVSWDSFGAHLNSKLLSPQAKNLTQEADTWPTIWMGYDTRLEEIVHGASPESNFFPDSKAISEPPFSGILRYCVRCCLPETAEGLSFDEGGMCEPCRSSEQKMHINWALREQQLIDILDKRGSQSTYDALIPISGGKDSTFQLHVLTKKYKRKILSCTFSHNWYSSVGRRNLALCLKEFEIDHLMMFPRRAVINRVARKSLSLIGDSCWHCHTGVGAFPLQVAVAFAMNLLIWGESVAERDGRATYDRPDSFDRLYFERISGKKPASAMVDSHTNMSDLVPYVLPNASVYKEKEIEGLHLGDFIFWDDERQMEFVRDNYGWEEGRVEGTYKQYKSVECLMSGMHDYAKYVKRGFGRTTDHVSQDIRSGLMTRAKGFSLIEGLDGTEPKALDYYCEISGFDKEQVRKSLIENRKGVAKKLPDD